MRLIAAALLLAVLSACSSPAEVRGEVADPAVLEDAAPQVVPAVLQFGESYTWPSGDTIVVGKPVNRVPDYDQPVPGGGARMVAVPFTVSNPGPQVRDAMDYSIEVVAGGTEAQWYVQPELRDLTGRVSPGSTQKFQRAYSVVEASETDVEVAVTLDGQPAFFRGRG